MYHDIHCPRCGHVNNPKEVRFSLTEFVQEIDDLGKIETYNDGILGTVDTKNINIITENELFWDMSEDDIKDCCQGEMFVLAGENIIRRFGIDAVDMLNVVSEEEIGEILRSNNVEQALKENENVQALVNEILSHIADQKTIRSETRKEERRNAVLEMIKYAKTDETLFMIKLHVETETDDNNHEIGKELRSNDNHIIGKSKKCVNCGARLSKLAGKYEEKVISFLGTPAAGKSAYLAATIHKLMQTGRNDYNLEVVFDHKSADYIEFRDKCLEPYSKGFAIQKTNEGEFPQISLALRNIYTNKTFLYTFVDMPGELFLKDEGFDPAEVLNNRGIFKHSAAVWFCVSANQLFTTKVSLPLVFNPQGNTTQNIETKDLTIMGLNTIAFMNELFKAGEKRPAVAMIVTKTDLLSEFVANTHFDGNMVNDKAAHMKYYQSICPMPQSESVNGYMYTTGEPVSLGYMRENKLNFQKLINMATEVGDFVKQYGENLAETFMGNVGTAFGKNGKYPCFAQASYGRDDISPYVKPVESAVRFLLNYPTLTEREVTYLNSVYGFETLVAFRNGEAPLPTVTNPDCINTILLLHAKYNAAKPFGVMNPLVWTLAYTGLLECTQPHGMGWITIPAGGLAYEELKNNLEHLIPGNITLGMPTPPPAVKPETNGGGLWGKVFGKK